MKSIAIKVNRENELTIKKERVFKRKSFLIGNKNLVIKDKKLTISN